MSEASSDDRKWKPGDVVRLKTGGWPMTVEYSEVHTNSSGKVVARPVHCVWFEKHQNVSSVALNDDTKKPLVYWTGPLRAEFHEDALEKAEPLK